MFHLKGIATVTIYFTCSVVTIIHWLGYMT